MMKTTSIKSERLGFKTYFGTTIMEMTDGFSSALMGGWFMIYLTDYAGIGPLAAIIGGSVLMFTRIFDAVNDPFQGWIIDRAKFGRFGKYKRFIIMSMIMVAVSNSCLFFMPESFGRSPVLACIWVLVFYLIYDIGGSFNVPHVLFRSLTLDPVSRGKLVIGPRFLGIALGTVSSALISIVNRVNASINNMHTSFGLTVMTMLGITLVISLIGISFVKEKHKVVENKDSQRVKLTEIFTLIRENKALRIKLSAQLFDGFIWNFLFSASVYFIKWAYCADLITGAVDTEKYGLYSMIGAMLSFLPMIIGTLIATPLLKKIGSAIRLNRILVFVQAISCGLLFVFQITGVLRVSPIAYFSIMVIPVFSIGAMYISSANLNMECMDYEIYKHGKDRSALCNACNLFVNKVQNAISAATIGVLLTAMGYVVDSATDTYTGDLSSIPGMLTGFMVLMGVIPFVCGIVSWLIQGRYPITKEIRADMEKTLKNSESI
jgi:Na+/melibiose symporter-like transporter